MKKLLLTGLLLLATSIFVFAGGGRQSIDSGKAADSSEIVLNFPHWFFSHGEAFGEWLVPAVKSFEEKNPGIKVNGYAVSYEEYWDKLDVAIAANSAPDVFALNNGNFGKYIQAGALLPLDSYVDIEYLKKNSTPLQAVNIPSAAPDGKTYTICFDLVHYVLMYRPSVWRQAGITSEPKSPEEFIAAMKKLKDAGITPYGAMTNPGNWNEQTIDIMIWIIGLGGHIIKDNKPALDSREVIQAFTYLKQLYDLGYIVRDTDKGTYRQMFANKRVGTLIDGSFMYTMLEGWDPSIEGDYVATNIPFPTQRVSAGVETLSVSSKTKHPKEAAALVEYLTGFEQQKRIVDVTGIGSTRTDIFIDRSFTDSLYKKWPWMKAFADHTDQVLNCPPGFDSAKYPEIQKILSKAFESVLFENVAPATAARNAQMEALAIF